jgi:hypothetical protein
MVRLEGLHRNVKYWAYPPKIGAATAAIKNIVHVSLHPRCHETARSLTLLVLLERRFLECSRRAAYKVIFAR